MSLAGYRDEDWASDAEVVDLLARQRALNFEPGTEFLYSNSGYFLLSRIVERATGRSLADVAAERIFGPLGMRDTHFHDDATRIVPNRAVGYAPAPHGYRIDETTLPMVGDGGLFTTVADFARWVQNLRDPRVGGEAWKRMMLERGVLANGDTLPYALGLRFGSHRGARTLGHGGAFVGFRADLTTFPDQEVAVFTLCNRSDGDPGRRSLAVADAILGDALAPLAVALVSDAPSGTSVAPDNLYPQPRARPGSLRAALLSRYAGTYRSEDAGVLRLVRNGGRLELELPGSDRRVGLAAASDTVLRLEDGRGLVVFRPGRGVAESATLLGAEGSESTMRRIEPWDPTPAELASLAGRYYGPEVDTEYDIVVVGGRVVARHRRLGDLRLIPAERDRFVGAYPLLDVRVERGPDGRAQALVVSAGRTRGSASNGERQSPSPKNRRRRPPPSRNPSPLRAA